MTVARAAAPQPRSAKPKSKSAYTPIPGEDTVAAFELSVGDSSLDAELDSSRAGSLRIS